MRHGFEVVAQAVEIALPQLFVVVDPFGHGLQALGFETARPPLGFARLGDQAGQFGLGVWWAATPKPNWPADEEWRAGVMRNWTAPYGDRRQELVFIGTPEMDKDQTIAKLDACLLTGQEMALGPKLWAGLRDPFPGWRRGNGAV